MPFLTTSDSKVISDNVDKANALNELFISCFNHKVHHPLSSGDSASRLNICTLNNDIQNLLGIWMKQ